MSGQTRGVGTHVQIGRLMHSPPRTRAYAASLVGRAGVVVAEIHKNTVAVVQLADDGRGFPAGARQWSLAWDDLHVQQAPSTTALPVERYKAGTSGNGGGLVQHAMDGHGQVALCGAPVRPVIVGDWHVPFVATLVCACSKCGRLAVPDNDTYGARRGAGLCPHSAEHCSDLNP
jgi:hypothetical protein